MNVFEIMLAAFLAWMALAIFGTGLAMVFGAASRREAVRLDSLMDDEFRRFIERKKRDAALAQEEEEYALMEKRYFGESDTQ